MRPVLLFTVEFAFQITGRGCVLVPGPSLEAGAPTARVGDRIRLHHPDGKSIDTVIRGLDMLARRPRSTANTAPLLLPSAFTKEDIPEGTEVWLMEQPS